MGTETPKLHVIFDGPPGPKSGRFVEVEDERGRSLNAGTWEGPDKNGLWHLVITSKDLPIVGPERPECYGQWKEAPHSAKCGECIYEVPCQYTRLRAEK